MDEFPRCLVVSPFVHSLCIEEDSVSRVIHGYFGQIIVFGLAEIFIEYGTTVAENADIARVDVFGAKFSIRQFV